MIWKRCSCRGKGVRRKKDTEFVGSGKNISNEIAVEHSSPASEDTLLGDKYPPKKSTVMKTVSSKKVGVETSAGGKKIARPDPKASGRDILLLSDLNQEIDVGQKTNRNH